MLFSTARGSVLFFAFLPTAASSLPDSVVASAAPIRRPGNMRLDRLRAARPNQHTCTASVILFVSTLNLVCGDSVRVFRPLGPARTS
uniref:Secreted protein n=1 Tax=Arundo donax TaxID=35708 RepID=A0A0A9ABF1_ARUDO